MSKARRHWLRYERYRWDDDRGDEYDGWGGSWWYFEFGSDGYATRQVTIYDAGIRLKYDMNEGFDEYGGLLTQHRSTMDRRNAEEITADEFEVEWLT